jgi:hypothetical protein
VLLWYSLSVCLLTSFTFTSCKVFIESILATLRPSFFSNSNCDFICTTSLLSKIFFEKLGDFDCVNCWCWEFTYHKNATNRIIGLILKYVRYFSKRSLCGSLMTLRSYANAVSNFPGTFNTNSQFFGNFQYKFSGTFNTNKLG